MSRCWATHIYRGIAALAGAGMHASVIRGGGPVRTIGSLSAAKILTVSIRDLTVTGGYSRTDSTGECGPDIPTCGPGYQKATALGGGIEVLPRRYGLPGAKVAISNTAVTGNRAAPTTTVPSVGAVCSGGPCPASQAAGGGIDNWGTLTLTNSVVSDNQAVGELTGQAGGGGIVDEASARLTLSHSSVTSNTASATTPNGRFADGGGIYVDHDGALTVQHSVIGGNTASLTSRYPASVGDSHAGTGGVDVQSGATVTIDHTSISDNRVSVTDPNGAPVGFDPGICACDSAAVAVVNIFDGAGRAVMRDSTISGNQVTATSRSGMAMVRGAAAPDQHARKRGRAASRRAVPAQVQHRGQPPRSNPRTLVPCSALPGIQ